METDTECWGLGSFWKLLISYNDNVSVCNQNYIITDVTVPLSYLRYILNDYKVIII